MNKPCSVAGAALLALALPFGGPAIAGPADYVFTPAVTLGEREIDFKIGRWKKSGEGRSGAASLGFGYGVTQNWFTEIYRKYENSGDEGTHFDAWEWENKFQLTEPGKYLVDIGAIVEIERPKDRAEGYEVVFGPLLQTEFGKVQLNANLLFEKHYRSDSAQRAQLRYQWQAKYRWLPAFEFGMQGFGDRHSWNHWQSIDADSNRLGPAVFGKLPLGNRQALRYNAAWLFATSGMSPHQNFRMQLEYEF
jgi:hypothetical protein